MRQKRRAPNSTVRPENIKGLNSMKAFNMDALILDTMVYPQYATYTRQKLQTTSEQKMDSYISKLQERGYYPIFQLLQGEMIC